MKRGSIIIIVLVCLLCVVLTVTIVLAALIYSDIVHVPRQDLELTFATQGDQLTLIGTLANPQEGIAVEFYQCSETGNNKVSLGIVNTDSLGVATYGPVGYDYWEDHWYIAATNG